MKKAGLATRLPFFSRVPSRFFLLFLFFTVFNAFLAYCPVAISAKLWLGLPGLALPLFLLFKNASSIPPEKVPFHRKNFFRVPGWLWLLGGLLAVFLRFYRLSALSVWPMWDDAHYSYFAIGLAEKWQWKIFFGSEQYVPVYTWLQGLYYKLFTPSLGSMWVFPVLISLPVFPLAYAAVRQYASVSFSFLYLWLLAFSFWPFYLTRFSTDISLCLSWEYACFSLFGLLVGSRKGKWNMRKALTVTLGVMVGTGWYVSKFWLANIPVFFLLVAYLFLPQGRQGWKVLGFFAVSFFLSISPLLWMMATGRYGSHIRDYSIFYGGGNSQWATSFSYLTDFLWGPLYQGPFSFGPLWGGFLNPVLGSALLLGAASFIRQKGVRFSLVAGLLCAFYLLPGVLSTSLEMMRVAPLMPVLLFLVALGFMSFFENRKGAMLGATLLGLSLGLDLYHLVGPYHRWAVPGLHSQDSKSAKRYRAFQILERIQAEDGYGLILTEFIPNLFDQSLLVATYPFNAARNPQLDAGKARWAALLTDDSLGPYLTRRFPRSQSYPLYEGLPNLEGNLLLFLLPLDDSSKPAAQMWLEAHRQIQGQFGLMPYHREHPDDGPPIGLLKSCAAFFQGDPFLESCYGEKLADLEDQDGPYGEEAIQCLEREIRVCAAVPELRRRKGYFLERLAEDYQTYRKDDRQAVKAFNLALRAGYESPRLYKQLMQSETGLHDYPRALWAAQQSLRLAPEDTPPPGLIKWLKERVPTDPHRASGKDSEGPHE